jgi:hypothetical protein
VTIKRSYRRKILFLGFVVEKTSNSMSGKASSMSFD